MPNSAERGLLAWDVTTIFERDDFDAIPNDRVVNWLHHAGAPVSVSPVEGVQYSERQLYFTADSQAWLAEQKRGRRA